MDLQMRVLPMVLLCACGRIGFDAPGGVGVDGGSTGDGGGSATDGGGTTDGSSLCVGAVPATTFPGGVPCGNWAANQQTTNAGLSESNGTLTITPNANSAGAEGECERNNVTIGAAGAFAEVSQVLAGASSQTRLEIDWGGFTFFVGASNNGMRAGRTDGVTFSGGTIQRWWRIRPSGGNVLFEASPDGVTWDGFASIGGVPSGIATLRVTGRTPSAEAAPGVARFESVNVCP